MGKRLLFKMAAVGVLSVSLIDGCSSSSSLSLFSSLIAIILAVFATYSITLFSKRIQDRILVFANMTANFAGIPLAFAFIVLLGNSGLFTLLFKYFG